MNRAILLPHQFVQADELAMKKYGGIIIIIIIGGGGGREYSTVLHWVTFLNI